MNILAVCTGNTCRSPIIMALVKKLHPDFCVDSAGIYALTEKVSENAVLALKEEDIDISGYVSKPLTKELISKADIILTATEEHKAFIEAIEKNKKIISLNCPDPYGAPLDIYIKTKNYLLQKLKEISFD